MTTNHTGGEEIVGRRQGDKLRAEVKAETTIVRKYYVTFRELKWALDLKGELHSSDLWRGLSPNEEEEGVSRDEEVIEIVTHEKTS
jgi:hypothetical protein